MSLFLLSSSWKILEDEYGNNYFYNPDVDKAAFEDTITKVNDKTAYSKEHLNKPPLSGSFYLEVLFAELEEEDDYFFTISTDNEHDKMVQRYKSTTKKKTNKPEWNEKTNVYIEGCRVILLSIWKARRIHRKHPTAQCIFPIRQYCDGAYNRFLYTMYPEGEAKFAIQLNSIETVLTRKVDYSLCPIDDKVFGAAMIASNYTNFVPAFLVAALQTIEENGLTIEGIYRVSGSTVEMKAARVDIIKGSGKGKDLKAMLAELDIHSVAGLVKQFLRELPEQLLGATVYEGIQAVLKTIGTSIIDKDQLQAILATILAGMDIINASTTFVLFDHLLNVANHGHENLMNTQSLSVVFGPTLLSNPMTKLTIRSGTRDSYIQGEILDVILLNWTNLRPVIANKLGFYDHFIKEEEEIYIPSARTTQTSKKGEKVQLKQASSIEE